MIDAQKTIKRALKFKENRQFDKAAEILREFLREYGNNFEVLWELADVYFEDGKEKSVVTTLRQALKTHPSKIQKISDFLEKEWKHARDPEPMLWFLWENHIQLRKFEDAHTVLERLDDDSIKIRHQHYLENVRNIEEYKEPSEYDDSDINTFFFEAELARHLGEFEQALTTIRKLIELQPAETQTILQIYEQEYNRNPQNENIKSILAEIYMQTDDIERAIDVFIEMDETGEHQLHKATQMMEEMLQRKPNDPHLLKGMAHLYLKLGNVDAATGFLVQTFSSGTLTKPEIEKIIIDLQSLADEASDKGGLEFALGVAYRVKEDYDQAIDIFRQLIKKDSSYEISVIPQLDEIISKISGHPSALLLLTEIEIKRKNTTKALTLLDQLEQIQLEDSETMVQLLLKILKYDEGNIDVHQQLGDIYIEQDDFERAFAIYQHLLEFHEKNIAAIDVVIAGLEKIQTKKPSYHAVSIRLAELYITRNSYQEAIVRLSDVLKHDPSKLADVKHLISRILNEDSKQAGIIARMYESVALKKDVDDIQVSLALAEAYTYEKQYDRAVQQLDRVLTLDETYTGEVGNIYQKILTENPDHHESRLALADLYIRQEDYRHAVDILREATQQNKNEPKIVELFYRILDRKDDEYTRQALIETLHERKLTDLTIQECEKVLEKTPTAAYAQSILADALIEKGLFTQAVDKMFTLMNMDASQIDEVLKKCDRILEIDQANVSTRYCRAEALIKKEDLGGAIQEFLKVLAYDSSRIDSVIEQLKRIVSLQHTNVTAHLSLGEVYVQKGEYDSASKAFSTALELDSDRLGEVISKYYHILKLEQSNVTAHFMLGKALLQKGEIAKGVEHLDSALELDFHFIEPVMREYQRALELDKEDAEIYFALGKIYAHKNLFSATIEQFTKATDLNPNFTEKVIDQYCEIRRNAPTDAAIHYALGTTYIIDGNYNAAIESLEFALKLDDSLLSQIIESLESIMIKEKDNPKALLALAKAYIKQEHFENAATHLVHVADMAPTQIDAIIDGLQMILEAVPEQVTSRIYLGDMYARKGEYDQATTQFELALKQAEEPHLQAELYLHLGNTYVALNEEGKAREAFLKAKNIDPANITLYQQLRELSTQRGSTQIQLLREQVKTTPDNISKRLQLVQLLREMGALDEAITTARFETINEDEQRRILELGRCFLEKGDLYTAIKVFSKIEITHQYLTDIEKQLLYYWAIAYERANEWQEAIDLLEKIQLSDLTYADISTRIANNYLRLAKDQPKILVSRMTTSIVDTS